MACVLWQGGKKLKTCIFRWRGRLSKEHKEWDQFLKSVTLAAVCYFDGNWTHCPRMPNLCWSVKKSRRAGSPPQQCQKGSHKRMGWDVTDLCPAQW